MYQPLHVPVKQHTRYPFEWDDTHMIFCSNIIGNIMLRFCYQQGSFHFKNHLSQGYIHVYPLSLTTFHSFNIVWYLGSSPHDSQWLWYSTGVGVVCVAEG